MPWLNVLRSQAQETVKEVSQIYPQSSEAKQRQLHCEENAEWENAAAWNPVATTRPTNPLTTMLLKKTGRVDLTTPLSESDCEQVEHTSTTSKQGSFYTIAKVSTEKTKQKTVLSDVTHKVNPKLRQEKVKKETSEPLKPSSANRSNATIKSVKPLNENTKKKSVQQKFKELNREKLRRFDFSKQLNNVAFVGRLEDVGKGKMTSSNTTLYTPIDEQLLLYDKASCAATEAFIRMIGLACEVKQRDNCDHMSPNGRVPFLRSGCFLVSEFEPIISFARAKGRDYDTENHDQPTVAAFISLLNGTLINIERYICWYDSETHRRHTKPFYTHPYPFPLGAILGWRKKWEEQERLAAQGWDKRSLQSVYEEAESCFQHVSKYLGKNVYMIGLRPSELDALIYGHVYAILSTKESPALERLAKMVLKYPNLIKLAKHIDKICFMGKFTRSYSTRSGSVSSSSTIESGLTDLSDHR